MQTSLRENSSMISLRLKRVIRNYDAEILLLFNILWIFVLSGCIVGPNYKRPDINTPATFRSASESDSAKSFAELDWWDIYKDQTLNNLISNSYRKQLRLSHCGNSRRTITGHRFTGTLAILSPDKLFR